MRPIQTVGYSLAGGISNSIHNDYVDGTKLDIIIRFEKAFSPSSEGICFYSKCTCKLDKGKSECFLIADVNISRSF